MKRTIVTTLLLLSVSTTFGTERWVPSEYPTIQAAVDECSDGDIVVIFPGIYRGCGNREIDIGGRRITVRSIDPNNFTIVDKTVIDCEIAGRGVIFRNGEDANSVIAGLTIINGHSLFGGGVYCCNKSSPTISNCVIVGNSATFGGGIACIGDSRPKINNCTISGNSASMSGGAVYCKAGSPAISNSIFSNNVGPAGGAISCTVSNLAVRNCTFSDNAATKGGAIFCYNSNKVVVENSILWADKGKEGPEIFVGKSGGPSSLMVSYCDVDGGEAAAVIEQGCILNWGDGNFDVEPMFVSGPLGDYYLDPNSPCVDAGSKLATSLSLDMFSTRVDGLGESGVLDVGYHYPAGAAR